MSIVAAVAARGSAFSGTGQNAVKTAPAVSAKAATLITSGVMTVVSVFSQRFPKGLK